MDFVREKEMKSEYERCFPVSLFGGEETFGRESMPRSERIPFAMLAHCEMCKSTRKMRRPT